MPKKYELQKILLALTCVIQENNVAKICMRLEVYLLPLWASKLDGSAWLGSHVGLLTYRVVFSAENNVLCLSVIEPIHRRNLKEWHTMDQNKRSGWQSNTSLQPVMKYFENWIYCSFKGKTVPLQAWSGPECSRKLRFPDFMTRAQDGGKVVSLTHWPPLPPGNTPGTHFC